VGPIKTTQKKKKKTELKFKTTKNTKCNEKKKVATVLIWMSKPRGGNVWGGCSGNTKRDRPENSDEERRMGGGDPIPKPTPWVGGGFCRTRTAGVGGGERQKSSQNR